MTKQQKQKLITILEQHNIGFITEDIFIYIDEIIKEELQNYFIKKIQTQKSTVIESLFSKCHKTLLAYKARITNNQINWKNKIPFCTICKKENPNS